MVDTWANVENMVACFEGGAMIWAVLCIACFAGSAVMAVWISRW